MNPAPAHGGPRTPGPGKRLGRPPAPNPLQRVSLRLSATHIALLRELGGGNVSEGVRRLLGDGKSDGGYLHRLLDAQREP